MNAKFDGLRYTAKRTQKGMARREETSTEHPKVKFYPEEDAKRPEQNGMTRPTVMFIVESAKR